MSKPTILSRWTGFLQEIDLVVRTRRMVQQQKKKTKKRERKGRRRKKNPSRNAGIDAVSKPILQVRDMQVETEMERS